MTPYYLRFTDEAQAIAALSMFRSGAADVALDCVEALQTASLTHALDVVGAIEGADGYHINLMIDTLPVCLESFVVKPSTPSRVFAGVN